VKLLGIPPKRQKRRLDGAPAFRFIDGMTVVIGRSG
jgi:hypothetical protein